MTQSTLHVAQIIEATNAGVARHVFDLVECLVGMGHRVELFYSRLRLDAANAARLQQIEKWDLVRCHPCDMRRSPHPTDVRVLRHITKVLKPLGTINLIHGHSTKGGAVARMVGRRLRKPVIYTPNAVRSMDPALAWMPKQMVIRIESLLSKWTTHSIAVSPEEQNHLVGAIGIPVNRTSVVANGIHPFEMAERETVRRELNLQPHQRVLGFVGRLGWQKGPDLLIEAMPAVLKSIPDLQLAIVGDGDMKSRLQQRVAELGIEANIHFLGFRDGQRCMVAFDGFVLPSRYEGLPYVLVEAMFAGLPIVASDQTGCRLLVETGKNGQVYPYDDRDRLVEAIVQVMQNDEQLHAMGNESKRRSVEFTAENMAQKTVEIYRSVLPT